MNVKSGEDVSQDLAYIPESSAYFELYWNEMNYCLEFALANRKLMMERVKAAFMDVLPEVEFADFINKPHNFAALEEHFGETVIVHRKGATRARKGEWGMIPGSQGTRSFLVKGKGEAHSFESCSHGAGRVMSRTRARKTLDLKEVVKSLDESGILHSIRRRSDLDEAPESYKDIDEVMQNQTDLVEVQIELQPLAVIKG
ncbi:MAG: RtcB family protein [Desulfobacterium sp.]|nr:RtcB family protein [Desulfobacterium sp.]